VGELNYQDALEAICGGHARGEGHRLSVDAVLIPQPDPHDELAVRVYIHGLMVAYLSREDARRFRDSLAAAGYEPQPVACGALVVGGWWNDEDDWGYFGVRLAISGARPIDFALRQDGAMPPGTSG
jgi:hypothetical protein